MLKLSNILCSVKKKINIRQNKYKIHPTEYIGTKHMAMPIKTFRSYFIFVLNLVMI